MFQTFVSEWKIQWRIFKIDFSHLIIFLSTLEDFYNWITIILVHGKLSFFIKFLQKGSLNVYCILPSIIKLKNFIMQLIEEENIFTLLFFYISNCVYFSFIFSFCFNLKNVLTSSDKAWSIVLIVDSGGSKYIEGPQVSCMTQ